MWHSGGGLSAGENSGVWAVNSEGEGERRAKINMGWELSYFLPAAKFSTSDTPPAMLGFTAPGSCSACTASQSMPSKKRCFLTWQAPLAPSLQVQPNFDVSKK